MDKMHRRISGMIIMGMLFSVILLSGRCFKKGDMGEKKYPETAMDIFMYTDLLDKVDDSSELPDWNGKQLKLTLWNGHGTGVPGRPKAEEDVVSTEVTRVTGVSIDVEHSFDNVGQSFSTKLNMMAASNDWPDLLVEPDEIKSLVNSDKLYDLTSLIPEYCPNLLKKIPEDKFPTVYNYSKVTGGKTGRIYAFPSQLPAENMSVIDPDIDKSKFSFIKPPDQINLYSYIWVRDDILKMLYPDAKNQKEIEEIYMKKGSFTEEDIFDVPIHDRQDFFEFLYNIKKLIHEKDIREMGRPVEVTYAYNGGDNWALMAGLDGILSGRSVLNNYYTYWDRKTQRVEFMLWQDWFKQGLRDYTRLIQDGIMSKESLIESNELFYEKLNNGIYSVTYAWNEPDRTVLEMQNKPYRYRKIYIDIPQYKERFLLFSEPPKTEFNVSIFKDSVAEEDLPQILQWLDFMISDIGEKLYYWGPETAGLWEIKNGKRVFKDQELEASMVYGKDNGKSLYYNLYNEWSVNKTAWPMYPRYMLGGSKLHPRYTYDRIRNPGAAEMFFNIAQIKGKSLQENSVRVAVTADIWNYLESVPEAHKFFMTKNSIETLLTKVLTANDNYSFEKLYKAVLDCTESTGFSTAALDKINQEFQEKNKAYLHSLK